VSFDRLASWYRALEWIAFGNTLQRCRVTCLNEIASPRRALIVGEGNGRFLSELLRMHPEVEIDCIDASQQMLQLARQRVDRELPGHAERVRFLHQDITLWAMPAHRYDLLVTHFFLDCFPEPALIGVIKKLAQFATDDANWLLADFCIPKNGITRLRARGWLAAMYLFFRITARIEASELIDPTPFMRAEGFALARQHLSRGGILKSEMWSRNRQVVFLSYHPEARRRDRDHGRSADLAAAMLACSRPCDVKDTDGRELRGSARVTNCEVPRRLRGSG
jgi:ubiquinone/menaquinone biosynthesis C-methylase UbiE